MSSPRALLVLLLVSCGEPPCGAWLETDWRPPAEWTGCIGVQAGPGGAIRVDGMDDACPSSQSCTLLAEGSDVSDVHYVRLADGPREPTMLFGVDCAANTCDEIERSALSSE